MKTPSYNIRERYDFFNRTLFDSKLPNDITLSWSTKYRKGGSNFAGVRFSTYPTRVAIPGSFKIILNSLMVRSNEEYDGILLHEMIHIHFFSLNNFDENHGRLFSNMATMLSQKSGIQVPMVDSTKELEVSENIQKREMFVVVLHLLDDTKRIGFASPLFWNRLGSSYYRTFCTRVDARKYKKVEIKLARTNLHRKYVVGQKSLITYLPSSSDLNIIESIPVLQTI